MKKIILILITSLLLTGCLYRQDIQQGNIISAEQVAQLKPGMTTAQVRYLMGTPILQNAFSINRWDYIYSFQPNRGQWVEKRVTLFFSNDILRTIQTTL